MRIGLNIGSNQDYREWYEKWPANIPCVFDRQVSEANAQFLRERFPWLQNLISKGRNHPIATMWKVGDADSFIRLNTLASNIRALDSSHGLPRLLDDMRRPKEFEPANHTLHMAAMFHRGGNHITQFFDSKNDKVPDFEANIEGTPTLIEAKKLTVSAASSRFSANAMPLLMRIQQETLSAAVGFGRITVAVKSHDPFPTFQESDLAIKRAINATDANGDSEVRAENINVFIQSLPANPGFSEMHSLHIMTFSHSSENERAERLIKNANRQLKDFGKGKLAGVTCLSVNEHQDIHVLRESINKSFKTGNFTNTGGVIIYVSAQDRRLAKRGPVDLVSFVANPSPIVPVHTFNLRSLGVTAPLDENSLPDELISCYEVMTVQGRYNGAPSANLWGEPNKWLPRSAFA